MANISKPHRSHISSKEARARGWRRIPVKGSGKKVIDSIPVSLCWTKHLASGVTRSTHALLRNCATGEEFICSIGKPDSTVHVQYNKLRIAASIFDKFRIADTGSKMLNKSDPKRFADMQLEFSGNVSKALFDLLVTVITVKALFKDADVKRMAKCVEGSSLQEVRAEFIKLALERAVEG